MSAEVKPEIDVEKLLSELADCMELDEFGHWFNKASARKVLKPLLDDSKQHDDWAKEIRIAEANTRKAMEEQQAANAQLQEAIRQRDEAREQLREALQSIEDVREEARDAGMEQNLSD